MKSRQLPPRVSVRPPRSVVSCAGDSGGGEADSRPIVFFDDRCGLCTGLLALLDSPRIHGRLRFEPLSGDVARRNLKALHFAQDTLWLKQGPRLHGRSSGVLRLMWLAGWPWSLAAPLLLVPRPLRDRVYDAIARNRHRLPWRHRADSSRT